LKEKEQNDAFRTKSKRWIVEEINHRKVTPLSAMHRANAIALGEWFGCELPDDFGDWKREYGCLRDNVALLDKNYRAYLKFTGPDRVRYLNAILTNDIKGLRENHANLSLFLNPQGHIQGEIETHALADKLFCVSFAMIRERLIPAMDKYIIMDDVTLEDRTPECVTLALEGPKAAAVVVELTGVDLNAMDELESHSISLSGIEARLVKRTPGKDASAEFLGHAENALALWSVLSEAAKMHGGGPAGYKALNSVRLEQGIPWFGYDFGEKQIPHEAGLQNSHISYTKGCYTGQEIVERVRSRGQVNRVRVSLRFESEAPPANAPLLSEAKELGYVTRVGFSPALNANIGMGYVRREKSNDGSALETSTGRASVITTPIS
jgi:aminomethyltransferase